MERPYLIRRWDAKEPGLALFVLGRCPLDVARDLGAQMLPIDRLSGFVEIAPLRSGEAMNGSYAWRRYFVRVERVVARAERAAT
jgi:hypothetical protein